MVADFISWSSQVLSTEWTLHHEVCQVLWRLWGMLLVDLFVLARTAGFMC